ncbi:MAG: CRTAC1 family protein [Verrucomicrobia bacterium]|nr:CRTAC1 family protein [Verrucomicrobiota bacterium]
MSDSAKPFLPAILVAILSIGLAVFLFRVWRESPPPTGPAEVSDREAEELAARAARFEAQEQQVATTVWAKELLAQDCARTFESLWDSLNAAPDKLQLVASFPIGEIVLGGWNRPQALSHGIELRESAGAGASLRAEQWRSFVEEFERAGWQLVQTEFRHNRFETDEAGQPRRSHFYFSAHLTNPVRVERAILEGDLVVDWAAQPTEEGLRAVKRIDASGLTLKTRPGEPPFRLILLEQFTPPAKSSLVDTLLLYDLEGDGQSEIILAARNLLYRRQAGDRYVSEPLCRYAAGPLFTGLIADLDGDGTADVLGEQAEGLVLFNGSAKGTFDQPGRLVWSPAPPLKNTMVLTCGDLDHDGDLDVFLGQYRNPTLGQFLKPSYDNANDGYPAYLLLNDGRGNFTDATVAAGLADRRARRVFSASFVDLDDDGNLDLLVVSDFAGVDLYRNDGGGRFTDCTRDWLADPKAFGMAHTLADFNADGRLDFLMIGMNSPTVERLEHLGLRRPHPTEDPAARRRMTFGNRLFLARPHGGFEQTALSDSLARTGWSWGCSAGDFDNDGFPDLYIANGYETKQFVRDYEPEFWLHDIYVDESVDDLTATAYFTAKFSRTRGQGWSYGGYEKNRLYLNQRGKSFVEAGHLLGVALEADSRNVVVDDLNGDGHLDLLVTTSEVWPERKQTLRVYESSLSSGGNWIGFRFREAGPGKSPVGARVTLRFNGRTTVRQIVTGDSFRSQHAATVHFGLGEADRVESVEIRWPNGQTATLRQPAVNRYHRVTSP